MTLWLLRLCKGCGGAVLKTSAYKSLLLSSLHEVTSDQESDLCLAVVYECYEKALNLSGVCRTLFVYFWHLADKGTSSYGVFTEWSRHVFWSYIILNKPFCEPSRRWKFVTVRRWLDLLAMLRFCY
ncbi:hypothetical protein LDENG_00116260 [Lucifuga dentata]|nr:hypothetical protein LDENG_00116260 [Lucifuga dentata]